MMMGRNLMLLIIGIFLVFGYSCKKGDAGAPGAQGPQGSQGQQGIQGIKGDDGSTIFSGADVPGASLGKNGDFYFRTTNQYFYGPKTATGWGTGVNLKGSNGTAGSKILSGASIPAATLGAVGDYYFKSDTYLFYGPKTSAGWGTGINLKGATGTANVIYSGWLYADRMKDSVIDGTSVRIAHIFSPRITASVSSAAAVLVYFDYGGGTYPLPFTSKAGGRMSTINFKLKEKEIVIYRFVYDNGALLSLNSFMQYRFVIIPGGVMAKLKDQNVDLENSFETGMALKNMGY